jgi:tRNA/tmRNA/rRNA uracil-C5-methylase (TrmA/RlmC/RlmD family)
MVRGRANAPLVGIFQEGTHDVVAIPRCVVHHPLINEAAFTLESAMKATRTQPYADASHSGLVRALQVVVERSSQRCQLVVVANTESPTALGPLLDLMQRALGEKLHSLWFNGHTARSNAILGPVWRHIAGPEVIVDEVGGARVFFPPAAFGQANPALMDDIVGEIHGWVPRGSRVLELYAGVGAIGLGLVRRGERVVFNEIGAGSLEGLERGIAEALPGSPGSATVLPGPAEQVAGRASEADVTIVDPPRKGLGDVVCQELIAKAPARLVYLSCGIDSFLREARVLAERYALRAVRAYGLFPYTDHVETLALFERKG